MVNSLDISFILGKTKLDVKKLISLIEEERDFHLLLDSISKTLTDSDRINYNKLSDVMRVRLGIYHFCKEDFDINEKMLIANIMANNYDYYYNNKNAINNKQSQEYKKFIKFIKKFNYKNIDNFDIPVDLAGFDNKSIILHIKSWIKIINDSKSFILGVSNN